MASADEELDRILAILASKSVRDVPRADVRALPSLYRRLISRLAEGRAQRLPADQLERMESAAVRCHALLYTPGRVDLAEALRDLFLTFPTTVRATRSYLGVAAAFLVVGTLAGYAQIRIDPDSQAVLLPGALSVNAEESFQEGAHVREGDPVYGAFYFTNNARVALNGYALGATLGIGTALVLLFNGVLLGATFAVVQALGSPRAFFAFILPHSGLELLAILLAAAGGLRLADGILRPGWLSRRAAFISAARESLPLALGASALLAVAGLVEGWVSPLAWPLFAKAMFGASLDLMLVAYLAAARASPASARARDPHLGPLLGSH